MDLSRGPGAYNAAVERMRSSEFPMLRGQLSKCLVFSGVVVI